MIAYELREAYAGTVEQPNPDGGPPIEVPLFSGGVISAGDRSVDVGEELERNGGLVLVAEDDISAIVALDEYPALKRTTVPEGDVTGQRPPAPGDRYEAMKVDELRSDPRLADVAGTSSARKPELVAVLVELDRAKADAGDDPITVDTTSIDTLLEAAKDRGATAPPAPSRDPEKGDE